MMYRKGLFMLQNKIFKAVFLLTGIWTIIIAGVFCVYNEDSWGWLSYVFLGSVVLSCLGLVLPQNFRKMIFFLLAFLLAVPGFLELESQLLYKTPLSYSSVLAILSTYGGEVRGLVGNFGVICLLPVLWLLFCLFLIFKARTNIRPNQKECVILLLLGCSAVGLCLSGFFKVPPKFVNLYQAVHDWIDFQKRSANLRPYKFFGIENLNSQKDGKLYVVVIGESVWRGAMSLYGHHYQTTPFMDEIKEQLYIFNDVVASGTTTQVMLNKILNFDNKGDYEGNLIDFFKSAGFKTYWLSAHARFGIADRYAHLVNHADYIKYINEKSYSQDLFGLRLDNELLPEMEKILADEAHDKVVFVHLLGSHNNSYKERYPKRYKSDSFGIRWLSAPLSFIEYLKSIHFTDQEVLKPLFEMVQRQKDKNSYVLYLSDHADDVSENWRDNACFCHFEASDSPRVYEIPFVLWFSEKYKQNNAEYVKNFASYVNRPYDSGHLIYSILDLSRLSHPKIDLTKSVFNQNFQLRKRAYDSMR